LMKIATVDHGLGIATLIVTASAFFFAGLAFMVQRKSLNHQIQDSKTQQNHNEKALLEQQTLGAWQVLANKSAGNSGKIEAIEFLAKQGKSLRGIDMSTKTHGGQVYLVGFDVSEKKLGKKADLVNAKFQGADLFNVNFEGAILLQTCFESAYLLHANFESVDMVGANFEGSNLVKAKFQDARLHAVKFEGAIFFDTCFENNNLSDQIFYGVKRFDDAVFKNNFIFDEGLLPEAPTESRLQFDFIFNEDGTKKSEPELDKDGKETGRTKYLIHLVDKKTKEPKK
jgi:uncharacterized protein YjbI with pentapeptide repeats